MQKSLGRWISTAALFWVAVVFGSETEAVKLSKPLDTPVTAGSIDDSLKFVQNSSEFKELLESDTLKIDLRYATKNNFMGEDLYGNFRRAYLHVHAFEKFAAAQAQLRKTKPGFRFIVFDALRPRSVQWKLFNKVKGTAQQAYVANPKSGSIHNFGLALDLSIVDEKGRELDMGTPYDSFQKLAEPQLEEGFLKSGELTATQLENRQLLRKLMTDAGFIQLKNEWWHFDSLAGSLVRKKFKIVE